MHSVEIYLQISKLTWHPLQEQLKPSQVVALDSDVEQPAPPTTVLYMRACATIAEAGCTAFSSLIFCLQDRHNLQYCAYAVAG